MACVETVSTVWYLIFCRVSGPGPPPIPLGSNLSFSTPLVIGAERIVRYSFLYKKIYWELAKLRTGVQLSKRLTVRRLKVVDPFISWCTYIFSYITYNFCCIIIIFFTNIVLLPYIFFYVNICIYFIMKTINWFWIFTKLFPTKFNFRESVVEAIYLYLEH